MTDRGSGAVELALLIPALLLMLAALGEVAAVGRVQLQVLGAAREGARVAATTPDTDAAISRAKAALGPDLAEGAVVSVRRPAIVGAEAEVRISVTHRLAAVVFGGTAVEVRSRAVMRVEA